MDLNLTFFFAFLLIEKVSKHPWFFFKAPKLTNFQQLSGKIFLFVGVSERQRDQEILHIGKNYCNLLGSCSIYN